MDKAPKIRESKQEYTCQSQIILAGFETPFTNKGG